MIIRLPALEAQYAKKSAARSIQGHAIRAEIIGSHQCSAEGYTVRSPASVLVLCRRLVDAGFDPRRQLDAYRNEVLALRVRSIGRGALLTVKERPFGPVFERWVPFSTPPVRPALPQNEGARL